MKNKIVSPAEAAAIIRTGDTVSVAGFVGIGTPDELLRAIEQRFRETGEPRDLTLVFAAAPGDGRDRGLNRLAHRGLIRRAIGGHWSLVPKLGAMAMDNEIEAYNLPLGCVSQLYRDIAAHRAGLLSRVGLRTFVDPRIEGGRLNARTTEDLVEVTVVGGKEYLLYKAFPIQIALIRGTTADTAGNITMEREALTLDALPAAMAARNSGGLVIAQVERIAQEGSLDARRVQVPGILVDCVVLAQPENHWQTYAVQHNGAFSGQIKVPFDRVVPLDLDERKVIARRAAMELPPGGVVNLGIGMPEGVAVVAAEEKILKYVTLTAEPGVIGGMPQGGLNFGAALNPEAVIQQNQQFDFYDGGGLALAVLGMAQTDREGNVNVSRFGKRLAGAGGFINISQNARKVVFTGSFTAGGLVIALEDGRMRVVHEGRAAKFIDRVEQITFSGGFAGETGQHVLYVTERCVFRRTAQGVELIEVAPGVDIERDILAQMQFKPIVGDPILMDARLFRPEPMGLEQLLLGRTLSDRISFDAERDILFINYEGFHIRTTDDVELVRREVEGRCRVVGHKIAVIVNYDGLTLDPAVSDAFFSMITYLQQRYYTTASRYTTSAFMRLKLGASLVERALQPHVFETLPQAHANLTEATR